MHSASRLLASIASVAFSLAAGVSAQSTYPLLVDDTPDEYTEDWSATIDDLHSPFHRNRFDDVHAQSLRDGLILEVATDMVRQFLSSPWQEAPDLHSLVSRRLTEFLGDFAIALRAPGIEGVLDEKTEQDAFLKALMATGRGVETLHIDFHPSTEIPGFFVRRGFESDAFWLYGLAPTTNTGSDQYLLFIAPEHMQAIRMLLDALAHLIEEQIKDIRAKNVKALQDAVDRWNNYLDKGYSQYPWESLLNGWLIKIPDLGPPDHQFIMAHPTLGIELSTRELDEVRVKESLNVELFGYIKYYGADLQNYMGASLAVSFREDLDPGLGFLLHLQRGWNVGLTWHDVDEDPHLFFSMDLFRFAGKKRDQYQSYFDRDFGKLQAAR